MAGQARHEVGPFKIRVTVDRNAPTTASTPSGPFRIKWCGGYSNAKNGENHEAGFQIFSTLETVEIPLALPDKLDIKRH